MVEPKREKSVIFREIDKGKLNLEEETNVMEKLLAAWSGMGAYR